MKLSISDDKKINRLVMHKWVWKNVFEKIRNSEVFYCEFVIIKKRETPQNKQKRKRWNKVCETEIVVATAKKIRKFPMCKIQFLAYPLEANRQDIEEIYRWYADIAKIKSMSLMKEGRLFFISFCASIIPLFLYLPRTHSAIDIAEKSIK